MKQLLILVAFVMLYAAELSASDSAAYEAYGLLIGSNRAGTGQTPLTYAHSDARRMATTLTDVAGFNRGNLQILFDPDKKSVTDAIDTFEQLLSEKAGRDQKTVFLFYYSGHARTTGLQLGADDFSLSDLKARLRALPATVTVVLLDACQTGAISNVKGVSAASATEQFSYNSVDQLNVSGMAVIASSSGSELSQESRKLRGSYFSHHFTVGLRGAADIDHNGVVTLAEAYNYAYHRTLSTTALTKVGRQHATLEMDLKGKGDMPFAWPGNFSSRLRLPRSIEGEVLLTHKKSGTVVAEIRKVLGQEYEVALSPGNYEGLVQTSDKAYQCSINIGEGSEITMDLAACAPLELIRESAKGGDVVYRVAKSKKDRRREYVMAELKLGYFYGGPSEYTRRLEDFRYKGLSKSDALGASASIVGTPFPFVSIGVTIATMDRRVGESNLRSAEQAISWRSFRVGGFIRGNLILGRALFVPYAQFGGGFARANFEFEARGTDSEGVYPTVFDGNYISGGLGVQMNPVRWFGVTLFHVDYVRSHLVKMTEPTFSEKHNNGGLSIFTGVRVGY
ncbi:MAG: caspase family protein [Deltaproteobacteria bacterium]|nr:caspase family protein [Deltaproteobacteria bacterium]